MDQLERGMAVIAVQLTDDMDRPALSSFAFLCLLLRTAAACGPLTMAFQHERAWPKRRGISEASAFYVALEVTTNASHLFVKQLCDSFTFGHDSARHRHRPDQSSTLD